VDSYALGDFSVSRIGFGAMQLPGPGVWGPPRDRGEALEVLRRAVELGVDHIDTAQYYGPDVANELIREALHPYPDNLALVSKVGARRDQTGGWLPYNKPDQLRSGIQDNLRSLGIEQLAAVNLRVMGDEPDQRFDDQLTAMIQALGLAPNVLLIPGTSSVAHLEENLAVADVTLDEQAQRRLAAAQG
jgi:aryl-alcohol dehydrogenase-like predicted oxidoreductase